VAAVQQALAAIRPGASACVAAVLVRLADHEGSVMRPIGGGLEVRETDPRRGLALRRGPLGLG
jgi:hypothetical protein